jgi:ribosomal protein S27AE
MTSDISEKLKQFRAKLFYMLLLIILPAIALDRISNYYPGIENEPVFIGCIFLCLFVFMVVFFRFINMRCPNCGNRYFTKHGLPQLFYRLICQNCGFNAFLPYKSNSTNE